MTHWKKIKIIISIILFICVNHAGSQTIITEEFTVTTKAGISLSGELSYPDQTGTFPAAILIWGNGPHTRDVAISGSPTFKQLAAVLNKQGMAVARFDKRGFGKSSGNFTSEGNYTTRDLANDVRQVYHFISGHPKIDTAKVGLIGTSEGSTIAYMVAAEEPQA